MTVITVEKRLVVAAGHHRQPRTTPTWAPLHDPADPDQPPNDYVPGSSFQHIFKNTFNDGAEDVTFAFASVSNGSTGSTSVTPNVAVVVGPQPTTVVGWYVVNGSGPGKGDTVEFVDAFSCALGDFVNDDFVTVTSDPSLTSEANVVGEVPTSVAETLVAYSTIASTGESFDKWIGGAPVADTDQLAQYSNGLAIASYRRPDTTTPVPRKPGLAELVAYIIYGIINDAPGLEWIPGVGPHPVDPGWGAFLERAVRAANVASSGAKMAGGAEITRLALNEIQAAVKELDGAVAQEVHNQLGR